MEGSNVGSNVVTEALAGAWSGLRVWSTVTQLQLVNCAET